MSLSGSLTVAGNQYVLVKTGLTKVSDAYILLSIDHLEDEYGDRKSAYGYTQGVSVTVPYVIGVLDTRRNLCYGTTTLIDAIINSINSVRYHSRLSHTNRVTEDGGESYEYMGSKTRYLNGTLREAKLDINGLQLDLTYNMSLSVETAAINKLLVPANSDSSVIATANFLDSSLDSLRMRGYDFDWMVKDNKQYIDLHNMNDIRTILVPAFIRALKKYRVDPDFEFFLVAMDFESDGLEAWCEHAVIRSKSVYLGISFEDHIAYGLFLDMEHFPNIEREPLAKLLTNMFTFDPCDDREVIIHDADGSEFKYMRSEIKTIAHHLNIDHRFGLLADMDIWFDFCTMQLGFNFDPFFSQGHNSLKARVEQFLGISYPDLAAICGRQYVTWFNRLSSLETIMMYGCADVDLLRLYAKILIPGIRSCSEYLGGDQVDMFTEYDMVYMNLRTKNDYYGFRVDRVAAEKQYDILKEKVHLYHGFMRQYIGRVKEFYQFYMLYQAKILSGDDVSQMYIPNLDAAKPMTEEKWSGSFLLDVLFVLCQYPKLVWTKPSKKTRRSNKEFVPKPAIDKDAVTHYLNFPTIVSQELLEKALTHPQTLEELKVNSMYLKEDYVNPKTGEVLVNKDTFNSYRYPFFYIIQLLSPIEKEIESDLDPILVTGSDYRFESSTTTSARTRRDITPLQTVSKKAKKFYKPYTDEYGIVGADQAAVEIRIAYGLTGDESLINPLNDPEVDPHLQASSEFFEKPAYLVDRELERKPVKFIHFGRIYGREVYSICKQIHNNVMTPENIASTARIVSIFDDKRAVIMNELFDYADRAWKEQELPEFFVKFHKLDPEKKYGRMQNIFNWCQHHEISNEEDWYEGYIRRAAMNFAVQGPAATILRILWTRLMKIWWKKNYLQSFKIIPHVNIHDEIELSYHRSLDPVEIALDIRKAFMVKFRNFPMLFVGINFGDSWGEAKSDERELPIYLLEEYAKQQKAGKTWLDVGHHGKFFLSEIEDYNRRRVQQMLLQLNKNERRIWYIEKISQAFENYTVRGILMGRKDYLFKIKDWNDPIETLVSALIPFLTKVLLEPGEKVYIICRGKQRTIVGGQHLLYASEADFLNDNPLPASELVEVDPPVTDEVADDEEDYFDNYYDLAGDDEAEFESSEEDYGGMTPIKFHSTVTAWDSGFMKRYLKPSDVGNMFSTAATEIKLDVPTVINPITYDFKNFTYYGQSVTIRCASRELSIAIIKFCKEHYTTSAKSCRVWIVSNNGPASAAGVIRETDLVSLDEFITRGKVLVS